ncbi:MAG: hypothetical protein HY904_16180 [Deltaproteobacteria bacterium]|nr:hypothetical protein [Deltaproteobacteria bacterium]
MRRAWVAVVAVAGVAAACNPFWWWPSSACDDDADCRSGRICVDGTCRAGGRTPAATGDDRSIAMGGEFACVLRDGGVTCWGGNAFGQLGTVSASPAPAVVPGLQPAQAITVGFGHACALAGGTAWCWGYADRGALGTGSMTTQPGLIEPVAFTDWVQVDSFGHHTCGIREGGALYCWGDNNAGQLGLGPGAATQYAEPVQVPFVGGVAEVSTGWDFTCVVSTDGRLWCFGTSNEVLGGRLDAPTQMPETGWSNIQAAATHVCGLRGGELWCWGEAGHVGQGDEAALQPTRVGSAGNWRGVTCGAFHSCAWNDVGELYCFGANAAGQLGTGPGGINAGTPKRVPTPDGAWQAAAMGPSESTCGLQDGRVYCWGSNEHGELGQGYAGRSAAPREVGPDAGHRWTQVRAGDRHACAVDQEGGLYCWGSNDVGQLGTADMPVQHRTPVGVDGGAWSRVVAGEMTTCAMQRDGGWFCFGSDGLSVGLGGPEQRPVRIPGPFVDAVVGNSFACFVDGAAGLQCTGSYFDRTELRAALPGVTWDAVAGRGDVVAGTSGGRMQRWTVWDADAGFTSETLPGLAMRAPVARGTGHDCAASSDGGSLFCMGDNSNGQLGVPDGGPGPQEVPLPGAVLSVCAGQDHTCAIVDGGSAWCWGRGEEGETGYRVDYQSPTPREVSGGAFTDITCGTSFTCGIRAGGTLWCWGSNRRGELGDGRGGSPVPQPVTLP